MPSITHCPICDEELWADGSTTPDGKTFIGMPIAGFCPNCRKYYYWSTGKEVLSFSEYSFFKKIFRLFKNLMVRTRILGR